MSRSLKITFLALFLFVLQMSPVLGCVNAPDIPVKVGQPIYTQNLGPHEYIHKLLSGHLTSHDWEFALANAKSGRSRESNSVDENGVAVALIHLGRTDEALKILEKLEKESPGSYYVAANLGTAYELIGDNERAYKWITEGMKRNPDSHFGTEWLHLKILKAKQEIKKDATWLETNSVLGIDWESIGSDLSKVQVLGSDRIVHTAETVTKAIEYQLHERTEFVKPTDPTVASLLYDLSHLVRHSRSAEHGELVLSAAHTYGYPKTSTLATAVIVPATEDAALEGRLSYWLPAGVVAGFLIIIGLAAVWVKRKTNPLK